MWLIVLALLVASCSTSTQPTMEAVSPEPVIDAGAEAASDVSVEVSADVGVEADTSDTMVDSDAWDSEAQTDAKVDSSADASIDSIADSNLPIDASKDSSDTLPDGFEGCITGVGVVANSVQVLIPGYIATCEGQNELFTATCYFGCQDNTIEHCDYGQIGFWSPPDKKWACQTSVDASFIKAWCHCPNMP